MSGPHGILSLWGDLKRAFDCDIQAIQITAKAQTVDDKEEITTVATQIKPKELEIPAKKPYILAPQKESNVKKIDLGTRDLEKTATISAHLSAKYELALINFFWGNKDIFTWKPADMLGVLRELAEH
jgi:hypothetical protein